MEAIRKAQPTDAEALQELYMHHLTAYPPAEHQDTGKWADLLRRFAENENYHILVLEADSVVVSSVTLVIIENLTHNMRPYAVIENVVTHAQFRGKHFATRLLGEASRIASERGCYKIMLMTGSKRDSTLRFYENAGFDRHSKTAFQKRL